MDNEKLEDLLLKVVENIPKKIKWTTVFGLINLEFKPNRMSSLNIQILSNDGRYVNLIECLDDDIWSELSELFLEFINENFDDKPDQFLFSIQSTLKYHIDFKYDVFQNDNDFLAEQLRWTYRLTSEVPKSIFLKKVLNMNLALHGEKTV